MAYKKSKIGQIVYVVYCNQICEEKVRYIGEDSFIVTVSKLVNHDYYEWLYDDYGITWANTFNKAKTILRKKLGVKKLDLELIEIYKDKVRRIKEEE